MTHQLADINFNLISFLPIDHSQSLSFPGLRLALIRPVTNITKRSHKINSKLDVRGSVHHSTIHTEISNKMQRCIKIYYSIFI